VTRFSNQGFTFGLVVGFEFWLVLRFESGLRFELVFCAPEGSLSVFVFVSELKLFVDKLFVNSAPLGSLMEGEDEFTPAPC
jgi:hypothetical protein